MKKVNVTLFQIFCLALLTASVSLISTSETYKLWKLPPEVRNEFVQAQKSSFKVEKDDDWDLLAANDEITSMIDVDSITKRGTIVSAKVLYMFEEYVPVDEHDVKFALRSSIYDCASISTITSFTVYYGENFKKIVMGEPVKISMPVGSIGYEEVVKICALSAAKSSTQKKIAI